MLERSDIAIVIPSFNEAKTIIKVVKQVSKYAYPIVIDDMSTDDTEFLLKKNKIEYVRNLKNEGYDQSLNIGFSYDGQHDQEAVPLFIEALNDGFDLVVGIRPYFQRFSERIFSILSNIRYKIKDPLCGMKGYKLDIYNEQGYFDSYESIGTELLFFNCKNKKKIAQIMINQYKRNGKSKLGPDVKINLKILRSIMIALYKWF